MPVIEALASLRLKEDLVHCFLFRKVKGFGNRKRVATGDILTQRNCQSNCPWLGTSSVQQRANLFSIHLQEIECWMYPIGLKEHGCICTCM
jgi:hypothetical protein